MVDLKDVLFTAAEIAEATGGKAVGCAKAACTGIATDSRRVLPGDLFVALCGENFDGNSFADSAFSSGARICLVSRSVAVPEGAAAVEVKDTGTAFLALAGYYRSRFSLKVAGITGSVGKTSTKEMTALALEAEYPVLKTAGNFNNNVGLPITLFGIRDFHRAAVVEMGMSGFGEISILSKTAKPDIAVITNIGMSHIERLGSMENILKAKLEITDGLSKNGTLILNGDDAYLAGIKDVPFRKIYYGFGTNCHVRATAVSDNAFEVFGERVTLEVSGEHHLSNACAAMAVAFEMGVNPKSAADALARFTPEGNRQKIVESDKGYKIICDYYNASPQSVEAALLLLSKQEGRKIVVLGDMLELGKYSEKCHTDAGEQAARYGADCLLAYGTQSKAAAESASRAGVPLTRHFTDKEKLSLYLADIAAEGDVILIKGSRGMKMEDVYDNIVNEKKKSAREK